MSLIAVFSDAHSNLEALEAVLADMDAMGVEKRVCLGDTVGYAANPAQCLETVRKLDCLVIKGNHDDAAAGDMELFDMRDEARKGIEFSRRKLTGEQRDYLDGLPFTVVQDGCHFVHASLDAPHEWTYVMRDLGARMHFAAQKHPVSFCGHTHVPVVWHLSPSENIHSWRGKGRITLPARGKMLINVGSVGQSRDLCPDACYAIYEADEGWVEFRRVPYDVEKTQRKIQRARLPKFTAQRLALGQ